MRSNNKFQSKIATPKPKVTKGRVSPLSVRKLNILTKRASLGIGRRNFPPSVRHGVKQFGIQNKENIDVATQRGNIKVVVRVRPPSARESAVGFKNVVSTVETNMVIFDPEEEENEFFFQGVKQTGRNMLVKQKKNMKLAFDRVYGPAHENEEIFHETIEPIIDTVLNGFNCSVFAYGSTGAGKTYTMLGSQDNPGMTFRTVMELYQRLELMKEEYHTEIAVSYLEVYNEMVRDLLRPSGYLNVREDNNGVTVPNLTLHMPANANQLMDMLSYGNSVRSQHPTDHNAESSRSHAVFQVIVTLRKKFVDLSSVHKTAKLVMVDLAGSERGSATGYRGQRFREGASINKSLLALANCINALADGKKHIPYRDSKLTRILKDSLGGNCRTVMIANVSPSSLSYDDTYNTLKYANRAKNIKCQVKKNVLSVNACVAQYTQVIEEMRQKIDSLTMELEDRKATQSQLQPVAEQKNILNEEDIVTFANMLRRKADVDKLKANAEERKVVGEFKYQLKQRRLESLQSLGTVPRHFSKCLKKQKDQLDCWRVDGMRLEDKIAESEKASEVEEENMKTFKGQFLQPDNPYYVTIPAEQYFDLRERVSKPQLDWPGKSAHSIMLEDLLQHESSYEKSINCLQNSYLILKLNETSTPSLDAAYNNVLSEFCLNRVHFSTDVEPGSDECAHPSISVLKSMIKKPSTCTEVTYEPMEEIDVSIDAVAAEPKINDYPDMCEPLPLDQQRDDTPEDLTIDETTGVNTTFICNY